MLPARPDHARAALRLALDLHTAASGVDAGNGSSVKVRVGLHSGPVTSGVIGHLRARFCLFGAAAAVRSARAAQRGAEATRRSRRSQTKRRRHCERCAPFALLFPLCQAHSPDCAPRTPPVASRMESSGRSGCVQMSDSTYQALGLPPGTIPQRRVDVKGKGVLDTYVLEAGSADAASVRAMLDQMPRMTSESGGDGGGVGGSGGSVGVGGGDDRASNHGTSEHGGTGADGSVARNSRAAGGTVDGDATVPGTYMSRAPSTMESSAAMMALAGVEAEEVARMQEGTMQHFVVQMLISATPNLFYLAMADRGPLFTLLTRVTVTVFLLVGGTFSMRHLVPPSTRAVLAIWWTHVVVWLHATLVLCLSATLLADFVRSPGPECIDKRAFACARICFRVAHAPLASMPWITAQLPASRIWFPEIMRNLLYICSALYFAILDRALTLEYAAGVAIEGFLCAAITPLVLICCYRAPDSVIAVLEEVETCPRPLRALRTAVVDFGLQLRNRYLGGVVLLDVHSMAIVSLFFMLMSYRMFVSAAPLSLPEACAMITQLNGIVLLASCGSKLQPGSLHSLDRMVLDVATATHARALAQLRDRLSIARSEEGILRAGCDILAELFPGASACAMGAFAEGSGCNIVSSLQCCGEDMCQAALTASLPSHVGAANSPEEAVTSVARTCQESYGHLTVLDSRELSGGISACPDWAAAVKCGLNSVHAITAPLNAGHVVVGFVTLHFPVVNTVQSAVKAALLRELSDAVGGAIFVRRAFAVNRDAFADGMRAAGVPSTPSDPRLAHASPTAPYPADEADAKALAELDERAAADKETLSSWALDAWDIGDEEVQRLCSAMVHSYGLLRRFRISPKAFAAFVADVRCRYNDNFFHNFRHAVMVMHTCWLFLADSTLRRKQLLEIDWLALLVAALVHDLEHPGTTNSFQINTASQLAQRYNDMSVLENHHCSTGFATMERAGILKTLDLAELKAFRKLVVAAILATDSARTALPRAALHAPHGARSPARLSPQCLCTRTCWRAWLRAPRRAPSASRAWRTAWCPAAAAASPSPRRPASRRTCRRTARCSSPSCCTARTCPARSSRPPCRAASRTSCRASLPARRSASARRTCPSPSWSPRTRSARPRWKWAS